MKEKSKVGPFRFRIFIFHFWRRFEKQSQSWTNSKGFAAVTQKISPPTSITDENESESEESEETSKSKSFLKSLTRSLRRNVPKRATFISKAINKSSKNMLRVRATSFEANIPSPSLSLSSLNFDFLSFPPTIVDP